MIKYIRSKKILSILLLMLTCYIFRYYTRPIEKVTFDKTNPAYVNNIYMSEERIYKNYLNESEKKLYNIFKNSYKNFEKTIEFNAYKLGFKDNNECISAVRKSFDVLMLEHPELLNLGGWALTYDFKGNFDVRLRYAILFKTAEELGTIKIQRMIDEVKIATKGMTDKEKIKYVYNYIGEKAYYDRAFTSDSKNQSAYNFFINDNAVCAGFAKAATLIFSAIGIESYPVSGYSTGNHMWNIVKYNEKYYYFDATIANSYKVGASNYYEGLNQTYMNYYKMDFIEWYPKVETTNMFDDYKN